MAKAKINRRELLKAGAVAGLGGLQVSEAALVRSICRESFWEFVQEFWEVAVTREPVWNWHIKYLCDELQKVAELVFANKPKEYDLIINIIPGSTKSTIASILFGPWVWTRMPTAQFITASHAHNLAMDLSRRSRDVVLSDKYRAVFPEIALRTDQAAKSHFMNTKGGFRIAVGTGGVTGFHGHFIVVDDPIDPNDAVAVSEANLKATNEWMDETLSQRKVEKSLTPTILIMQRLHQNDPTQNMIDKTPKGKLKHICLPGEVTANIKPKELVRNYVNGLLDPVRASQEVLDDSLMKLGEYGYAGQILQDPKPRGGGMFKTERITLEDAAPNNLVRVIRYWDKAGTPGGGAYTVGLKMGKNCDGRIWLLDVKRGRWDSARREAIIKQTAELDGKDVIIGVEQEPGSGGKDSAENTVKNLSGYRVRIDRPTGDKVIRADPFSTQVNAYNVFMVRGDWNKPLLDELGYFPYSTYKDQADSASGAFKLLNLSEPWVGVVGLF